MIRAISSRLQPIPLLPGRFSVRVEPGVVPFLAAQSEKALLVTASGREAEEYASALEQISPGRVSLFPAWETLPHERLSPRADTVARRLTTLAALENKLPESDIIVAPKAPEDAVVMLDQTRLVSAPAPNQLLGAASR